MCSGRGGHGHIDRALPQIAEHRLALAMQHPKELAQRAMALGVDGLPNRLGLPRAGRLSTNPITPPNRDRDVVSDV